MMRARSGISAGTTLTLAPSLIMNLSGEIGGTGAAVNQGSIAVSGGGVLTHSALLGVGLGLLAGIDVTLGVIVATMAVAVALLLLRSQR